VAPILALPWTSTGWLPLLLRRCFSSGLI
jgi:hypothetical protein